MHVGKIRKHVDFCILCMEGSNNHFLSTSYMKGSKGLINIM